MATSDDDGATSNEVDDDGDGATGNEDNNDDDDGNGDDDGDGDGAMGSGATGYYDNDDGRTIAAKRRHAVGRRRPMPPPNDDAPLPCPDACYLLEGLVTSMVGNWRPLMP
jgi:hypothetical protein